MEVTYTMASSSDDLLSPMGQVGEKLEFHVDYSEYFINNEFPPSDKTVALRSKSVTMGRFRFRLLVYPYASPGIRVYTLTFLSAFIEADVPEGLVAEWAFPRLSVR